MWNSFEKIKNRILILTILFGVMIFFFTGNVLKAYGQLGNLSKELQGNQELKETISSGPLNELWNLLGKIKVFSISNMNFKINSQNKNNGGNDNRSSIFSENLNFDFSRNSLLSDLNFWWDKINSWFEMNIGVSLRSIIKVVINIVIWIWELIIGLLKGLASRI